MDCVNCAYWVRERRRRYIDGTEITYFTADGDKGHCEVLGIQTNPDFGCLKFQPDPCWHRIHFDIIDVAPWERWTMVACPDCKTSPGMTGDGITCRRCSGTAKVRLYDDGYVADETWEHPKQKERNQQPQGMTCPYCNGTGMLHPGAGPTVRSRRNEGVLS